MAEVSIVVDCVDGSDECDTLVDKLREVIEDIVDHKIDVIENNQIEGLLVPAFQISSDCGKSQRVVGIDLGFVTREFIEGIINTVTCKER